MGRRAVLVSLLAIAGGCWSGATTPKPVARPWSGLELVVGSAGDPAILDAIRAQAGEWERKTGARITIDPKATSRADVLIFPGDRTGALIDAGFLAVIPDTAVRRAGPAIALARRDGEAAQERDTLDLAEIVPAIREQVSRYGPDRIGLPLGGSALVLVYRRDAFESSREAARAAGIKLEPPETWAQLDALARFFQGRDFDGDGQAESGIALALGPDVEGVGDAIFLARAAALGQHPDQYSFLFDADDLTPRINSPPFVEALEGLVALKQSGPPRVATFDAEAARAAFRNGEVAFLIDRAERASRWTDPKSPITAAVAPLPGSTRLFDPERQSWHDLQSPNRPSYLPRGGGWLAGVAASATGPRHDAALDFIKFLAGPDVASSLLADPVFPMLPVRESQLGQGPPDPRATLGIDPSSFGKAVQATLTTPQVVPGLRIPEADGYLADLATARRAALGGTPAQEALDSAARAWTARTARLGHARQLWHYRRSLNRLTTVPEPPPREP
jgi:multiple sugar transport system substrate-binding protein